MSIVCSLVKAHEIVKILITKAISHFRKVAGAVGILGCSWVQATRVWVQTGESVGGAIIIASINAGAFAAIT